jgi:hypothetical protein
LPNRINIMSAQKEAQTFPKKVISEMDSVRYGLGVIETYPPGTLRSGRLIVRPFDGKPVFRSTAVPGAKLSTPVAGDPRFLKPTPSAQTSV